MMSHEHLSAARIVLGCTMLAFAYDEFFRAAEPTSLSARLDAAVFARLSPEVLIQCRRATAVLLATTGLAIVLSTFFTAA